MLNGTFAELGDEKSVRVIFIREDFEHTVTNDRARSEGAERKFGMARKEGFDDLLIFRGIDGTGRINESASRFQIRGIGFQNLCLQNGQTGDILLRFVTDVGFFAITPRPEQGTSQRILSKTGISGL